MDDSGSTGHFLATGIANLDRRGIDTCAFGNCIDCNYIADSSGKAILGQNVKHEILTREIGKDRGYMKKVKL